MNCWIFSQRTQKTDTQTHIHIINFYTALITTPATLHTQQKMLILLKIPVYFVHKRLQINCYSPGTGDIKSPDSVQLTDTF
jgi:hypothetical protein